MGTAFASVAVLKGSATAADFTASEVRTIVGVTVLAFVAGLPSLLTCNSAAYGVPGALNSIETSPESGLAGRLAARREEIAAKARGRLKAGIALAVVGILCAAAASLMTLFPQGEPPASTVCLYLRDAPVATVKGPTLPVVSTEADVRIGACPSP